MKWVIGVLFVIVGAYYSAVTAKSFWRGTVLTPDQVVKKWGRSPLDTKAFSSGSADTRAKMAYEIVSNKQRFLGKSTADLRAELGDPDGFYFTDVYPAYIIHEGKTHDEGSWQIVFLLNKDRRVTDVFVHKNCCD